MMTISTVSDKALLCNELSTVYYTVSKTTQVQFVSQSGGFKVLSPGESPVRLDTA